MENFRTLPTTIYFNPKESLQISNAELVSGDFSLACDIINMSEEIIKKITLGVKFKNFSGAYLLNSSEFYFTTDVDIGPYSTYFLKPFSLDERFADARSLDIRIFSYITDKGGVHTDFTDEIPINLPLIPEKKLEKIRETLGPEIKSYGENHISYWSCVCTAINPIEEEKCRFCGRHKNFVLNNLTEPLINSKIVNIIQNTSTQSKIEIENLERNLTRDHITKVAPNAEKISDTRVNEEDLAELKPAKKSKFSLKSIAKIFGTFLILIILIFLGRNIYTARQIALAKSMIESGEYQKAYESYQKISYLNPMKDMDREIQKVKELIESDNNFNSAKEKVLAGEYLAALSDYKKVIGEDEKNYRQAGENMEMLENLILEKALNEYREGNKDKALSMLNEYLIISPESVRASNLLADINSDREARLSKDIKEEFEEDKKQGKDGLEINKLSDSLLHTFQKVTAEKANLRTDPSVDADIVRILKKGTDLYIEETKIEGKERIWCYVQAKNQEDGNSYRGWISHKTLIP